MIKLNSMEEHIYGVAGSNPVATTKNSWKHNVSKVYLFIKISLILPWKDHIMYG